MEEITILISTFVVRLATGDVVEKENVSDKKVEGSRTPPSKGMRPR